MLLYKCNRCDSVEDSMQEVLAFVQRDEGSKYGIGRVTLYNSHMCQNCVSELKDFLKTKPERKFVRVVVSKDELNKGGKND